jgi:hypothetical protein
MLDEKHGFFTFQLAVYADGQIDEAWDRLRPYLHIPEKMDHDETLKKVYENYFLEAMGIRTYKRLYELNPEKAIKSVQYVLDQLKGDSE